jgi:GxxExxY protein
VSANPTSFTAKDAKVREGPQRTDEMDESTEPRTEISRRDPHDASNGPREEVLASRVLTCAFRVHSALGPGLLESAYEACLAHELAKAGLACERQVTLPVRYDGLELDAGYRLDMLVETTVIIEVKAVERLLPVHVAQLLSYLKLSNRKLGLLLNFNVIHLKDGIRRVVNGL